MKYVIKFEWIFVTLLLAALIAIFFAVRDAEMQKVVLLALTSAFSGGVGYIYGKSRPEQ